MQTRSLFLLLFLCSLFAGCYTKYNCYDEALKPVFVGFELSDIDTIIIRKFNAGTNFQNLVDTFIADTVNTSYIRRSDSTTVFLINPDYSIKVDYDWQLFIPGANRTIFISDIVSENLTGKKTAFMEPVNSQCYNRIFSVKVDSQIIHFTSDDYSTYIY